MSIKTIIIAAIALVAVYGSYSFNDSQKTETPNPNGIHFFEGNWRNALAEAKNQDKLLFVDVYTTWCGPCKVMKKTTFNDEKVGAYFNSNFINVAIDAETPEGKKLMAKYAVRGFPTLLIVNGNGHLKSKVLGFQSANKLIGFGKKNIQ